MTKMESRESLSRFASFTCDLEDEPLSEQDLHAIQAIEAQFQSSPPSKRPLDPSQDHCVPGTSTPACDSSRRIRRRLPKSLVALQHPLPFSLSPCQGYSKMRLPIMKFAGKIMYSKTANGVEKAALELLNGLDAKKKNMEQIVLGLDIEWRPSFRRGVPNGKVAVMQICDDTDRCHVLHIIHSGIPPSLKLLLEDPTILKAGVGIGGDARKFFKDYEISIKGVEDLSFLAKQKLVGDIQSFGLTSLTEKLLSKQLKKPSKIRLGNWEALPLSEQQLDYAAIDAYVSWYLYQVIKELPDHQLAAVEGRVEDIKQQ
ncbi:Werner Syndrome-like exonuclease [Neltuma alba]|uniref:Werner Syndrome-like exonuclease n=1 Tax=Neltuma alba TaxID=207710 RepID=UPI0010A39886|nr:Werner Syndrome-like exonuclease [Prosopis alba]